MSIHVTSINGMGSAIISGSSVVTQGMRAEDYMHMSRDFILQAGVVKASDLAVVQNGTPNRSVNVGAGVAYVLNPNFTDNSNAHAKYFNVTNDATANVAINTNTSGNPRYTSIFMKIDLSATPGANGENSATLVAVDGTPAASPTPPNAPSDGNCYLRLADVLCANGFSSITNANITDKRLIASIGDNLWGWKNLPDGTTLQIESDADGLDCVSILGDWTSKLSLGNRILVVQGGTTYYAIINKIYTYGSVRANYTTLGLFLTVTSGTRDRLGALTPTLLQYSYNKFPVGFPVDILRWSVFASGGVSSQASPVSGTFYNIGGYIDVPAGSWDIDYKLNYYCDRSSSAFLGGETGLSTSPSSKTETESGDFLFDNNTVLIRTAIGKIRKLLTTETRFYVVANVLYTSISTLQAWNYGSFRTYRNAYL